MGLPFTDEIYAGAIADERLADIPDIADDGVSVQPPPAPEVYGDDDDTNPEVPGEYEVWEIDGERFMVWTVPLTDPPVYLAYKDDEDYTEGETVTVSMTGREAVLGGVLGSGGKGSQYSWTASMLPGGKDRHPFEELLGDFESLATVQPWLRDPDMLAILARAELEDIADITDLDHMIQQTNWWKTHSTKQRDWLLKVYGDPATAQAELEESRAEWLVTLRNYGIKAGAHPLKDAIADAVTRGDMSKEEALEQLRHMALGHDPTKWKVHEALKDIDFSTVPTIQAKTGTVEALMEEYIGQYYMGKFSEESMNQWATRLLWDDEAGTEEEKLRKMLQNQRQRLFRMYDNPNLTYNEIAMPLRQTWYSIYGEEADESTRRFVNLLELNDPDEARRRMLEHGLRHENSTVTTSFLEDITNELG